MTTYGDQRWSGPLQSRPGVPVLKRTFGSFPTGVTAVCGSIDGRPVGMTASSFTSVSMDPPLVSVCISNDSATWPVMRRSAGLGISVLSEQHSAACRQLAGRSEDRFIGIAWAQVPSGAVFIRGATAWMDCTLEREVPAGDHRIALLRIHAAESDPEAAPLVFHASGFRRLATESRPLPAVAHDLPERVASALFEGGARGR
jgi:flavin reductase (DIM6/NTAB) family NADH-FMN oxidoreductase RutF